MQSSLPDFSAAQVLIGLVAVPVVVLAAMLSRKAVLFMLGILLFLASIGVARDWLGTIYGSWILPLQQGRNVAFSALAILLVIGAITLISNSRVGRIPLVSWLVLAIGLYQSMMRMSHEGGEAGLISIAFTLATILPLIVLLPAMASSRDELKNYAFIVAVGFLLFTGACVMQAVTDPSKLTIGLNDRFIGVSSNPQHAAVLGAGCMIFAAWRAWGEPLQRGVIVWVSIFIACGIAVVLTGSRTGLAMAAVGIAVLGYRRIGRSVLLLPIVLAVAFASLKIAEILGVDLPFARLSEGGDTRSIAWAELIADFQSAPMTGVGMEELEKSENSFLFAAASFGIGMVGITLVLAIAMLAQCVAIFRATLRYRKLRPVADLVIGFNLAYLFGANFEGYIMSRNSGIMVLLLISASAGSVVLTAIRKAEASDDHEFALAWGLDELVYDDEQLAALDESESDDDELSPLHAETALTSPPSHV